MQCGRILRRATIFVADAEASARFYQAAFGFGIYSDQTITLSEGSPVTFGDSDDPRPGRFITVKGTHPLAGMIGLISIDGSVQNRLPDGRLGIGNVVLVIEVEDIEAAASKVTAAGGKVVMALHDASNTGDESGNKVQSRRLFAHDPDGYVLEVFEPV